MHWIMFLTRSNKVVSRASSKNLSSSPATSPAAVETEVINLSTDRPLKAVESSTSAAMRRMIFDQEAGWFDQETDGRSLGVVRDKRKQTACRVEGAVREEQGSKKAVSGT